MTKPAKLSTIVTEITQREQLVSVTTADIDWNDSGTPVATAFDDVYFSNDDGLREAEYVFLRHNQLPNRWLECSDNTFVIAETGFGTGLNFLVTLRHFAQFRQQHPNHPLTTLFFISCEKYPLARADLTKALAQWPELALVSESLLTRYPPLTAGCHRLQFPLAAAPSGALGSAGKVNLDLWLGDVNQIFPALAKTTSQSIDAWFLDGFAPRKNPDMWQPSLFASMAELTVDKGTFATFTAAGVVKRGLAQWGFTVQKCAGFGSKREMLRGYLQAGAKPSTNTASARVKTAVKPLSTEATNEAVSVGIVGGGLAALNVAWSFAQYQIPVTLYCDQQQLATGASGNSQGALYPQLSVDVSLASSLYVQCFHYAVQRYRALLAQGLHFGHDFCGVLLCAFNDKQVARHQKLLQLRNWPRDLVQGVSAAQANAIAGVDIHQSGLFIPDGGWLNPKQLTYALAAAAQRRGLLNIKYHKHLRALESLPSPTNRSGIGQPPQWRLHWRDGEYSQVSTLVIATAHNSMDLAQMQHIPLQRVRGQVESVPASAQSRPLQTVLCHKGYATPAQAGEHAIGASYVRDDVNCDYRQAEQCHNRRVLQQALPASEWVSSLKYPGSGRASTRCTTRDRLPVMGQVTSPAQLQQPPLASAANSPLFTLTGLGSRGLCTAPLLAEALVCQILGKPVPLSVAQLAAVAPKRFV